VRTEADRARSRGDAADIGLFHQFSPPPAGGGHQFLRALVGEWRARGVRVEENRISGGTRSCLLNSFNFDSHRLRRFARSDVRMVHRVDGPVSTYRGYDDGTDARILSLNREFADATIFQSRYSLEKHLELGLELRSPVVIPNTVDPVVFHPPADREPISGRRVRLVATSWSDNPRKGTDVLRWLDEHLDLDRFELLFVGRAGVSLRRVRTLGPVASEELAGILRGRDIYLAASRDDPCSNALLEGLACGLPAAYLRSGGHPELVGEAGIGFDAPEQLPDVLEQLAAQLEERRAAIRLTPLAEVADRYLEVLTA
jgi:glycosyltransferase involved in cell wall biosynthesis